jgi:hypothetical protein
MLQLGLGFDHVSLDWRGKECGFQITHKGYIELANLRAKAAA